MIDIASFKSILIHIIPYPIPNSGVPTQVSVISETESLFQTEDFRWFKANLGYL